MFKKLSMLLLAAATLVACNDDNDDRPAPVPADGASYIGTLDVTPLPDSPFSAFSEPEILFALRKGADGGYLLDMPKIKFVAEMPVYISFEIRGLEPVFEDGGFRFSLDETVPYRNGAPYDPDGQGTYTIRNLQGESADGSTMRVTFDCYTMHVAYNGIINL